MHWQTFVYQDNCKYINRLPRQWPAGTVGKSLSESLVESGLSHPGGKTFRLATEDEESAWSGLRPLGRSGKRRRNREELDAHQVSDWFVGTGDTTDMSHARIDGHFMPFELEVQGLNGLGWHGHWRREKRAVLADVDDTSWLCQFERRPQGADDFQANAGTTISKSHQRRTS